MKSRSRPWRNRSGLIAIGALALSMGAVGLTNEAYAPAGGDAARHIMNGVFFYDLLSDRPFAGLSQPIEYAHLYYARYPALSLGHHPVLLPVLEAPLFALFGISVSVARLIPLASFVVAAGFLYAMVSRCYGTLPALFAGLLFVTSPVVVASARVVMAEILSLALLLACVFFLREFWTTERRAALIACAVAAILCVYAKPNAVLLAPALALSSCAALPVRRLLSRDVLFAAALVVVLTAPAVTVPMMLSGANVSGVVTALRMESGSTFPSMLVQALRPQLAWPVLVAAAAAVVRAGMARDARAILFVAWVLCVGPALYFFGGSPYEGPRYTLFWVPALCALAASLVSGWRLPVIPVAVAAALLGGVFLDVRSMQRVAAITGAGGYEEAAQFVLAANPRATVLFSGDVDTGYFSFFVRKHDADRELIVLRSDKIFTTSRMARLNFEDRITSPEQIYPTLRRFGTRYVVVEDRPSRSEVLEWLRQELKTPRFVERKRIPIRTTDFRLRGTSLAVFELLDVSPPDPKTELSMRMPTVNRSLNVTLGDLLDRKLLRR